MTINEFMEEFQFPEAAQDKLEKLIELTEDQIAETGTGYVFDEPAAKLVHEIHDLIGEFKRSAETSREIAEYEEMDLSAEYVYLDMLLKIGRAPTRLHYIGSVKWLIPIIDKKLREREKENEEKRTV